MEITYMKPFGVKLTNVDLADPEHTKQIPGLLYDNGIVFMPSGAAKPGTPALHEVQSLDSLGKLFGYTCNDHPVNEYIGETAVEVLETGGDSEKVPDSYLFHSDTTWRRDPNVASVICCKHKPSVGGSTRFQDVKKMFARLSDKNREILMKSRFLHSLHYGYQNVNAGNKLMGVKEQVYVHPGMVYHPKTHVPLCYVNRGFTLNMEGKTVEESQPLLKDIFTEIYSEDETYTHNWAINDVVIWDNMGTHHQAPFDYYDKRVMHRVIARDPANVPAEVTV